MNLGIFLDRVDALRHEYGYHNEKLLLEELHLGKNSFGNWRNGMCPSPSTIKLIAQFFGVTVDYLVGDTDDRHYRREWQYTNANHVVDVPVYESVSAGYGVDAHNTVTAILPLYFKDPVEGHNSICIKVTGDSMYPKIEDGDYIVVHKTDSADNGDIAVIMLDRDEGLVKRIELVEDGIVLHSFNPMYPSMSFRGKDAERVRIIGKVTKIIKEV